MKIRSAFVPLALAAALPAAHAKTAKWPERPVRAVVPFAPGGATDVVARLIAPKLTEELGQQFVIDNRAGAGGSIGVEIVVRANPDGHTILIGASSYASNVPLYKLTYDPLTGISPVTLITKGPFIIAVHPSVKAASLKDFIALARAADGQGPDGARPFQRRCAIIALLGGQIQIYFGGPLVLSPHINAGKLRGLSVTSEQRSPVMPDLPAVSELIPGYSAFTWFGMWAPPGTPKAIVSQLNQAVARILKKPDVREGLRNDGMEAAHNSPEELSRFIAADIAKWTKVVKAGNIKID